MADIATTTYHGVELEGEGLGTRINFTPSSALTDGIRLRMTHPRLSSMRVYGNSNVTNVIHVTGAGVPNRNDYGILDHLQIDGAPATQVTYGASLGVFTAGQKGIFFDGSTTTPMYWWHVHDIDMRGLDIGMHLYGEQMTSTMQTNITGNDVNIGEKISGGQHNIVNCWFQASGTLGVGVYGIWLTNEGVGNGSQTRIQNVMVEGFDKTGAESAAICIDTNIANIFTSQITNVSAGDNQYHYAILDKNIRPVNHHTDWYLRRDIHNQIKTGHWQCGNTPFGLEDGMFRRSIVESPLNQFTSANTSNGPTKIFNTTTGVNSISSIYYNKHDGYTAPRNTSNFSRGDFPKFTVRFLSLDITQMRMFIGFWNAFAAPTSSADILNAKAGVGLWLDTGVSPNWKIMHNDNAGASTITQIGSGLPVGVYMNKVEITLNDSTGKATLNFVSDGNPWTTITASTNVPDNSYQLGWLISLENLGAGKTIFLYDIDLEVVG